MGPSVSPRVAVTTVSPQDGTQRNSHARLTRVSARSPVLVHGIHLVLPSQLLVPVKRVTITVPRSTRRSTASAPATTPSMASRSRTTPPPRATSLTSQSTQSAVSFTTVSSRTTLYLSRVALWAQRSVPSPSASLFSSRLHVPLWRMSISSSSTPLPKWVTVVSRHPRRRSPSWVHSRRIAKLSLKLFEPTFKNG